MYTYTKHLIIYVYTYIHGRLQTEQAHCLRLWQHIASTFPLQYILTAFKLCQHIALICSPPPPLTYTRQDSKHFPPSPQIHCSINGRNMTAPNQNIIIGQAAGVYLSIATVHNCGLPAGKWVPDWSNTAGQTAAVYLTMATVLFHELSRVKCVDTWG